MSFAQTSTEYWLEDGHILHAYCQNADGDSVQSQIDLNGFIGNSDGWFEWGGVDFTETAENIQLEGSRLTAELYTVEGGTRERQGIELNDRIGNDNGQLSYIGG
ncbi:Cyanovirin-N [Moelleriella libera RCEF 2490]|uniref:Cyanovirin-N n=1 Tax=Moelleriella libera RCEF 2490 TaxID=1081109 RepID=A0A162I4F0_9HYPO|nr:Cyanovirin-N [Moelleriella libera RCEF 2490]